jgi:hypothetical protein
LSHRERVVASSGSVITNFAPRAGAFSA